MAAQSSLDLSDPLNRLASLPQAVNWRGTWSPAIVYYRNDIVLSPLNFGSYINIFPGTTIRGGGDPSTNPVSWYAFGAGAVGVQEIQGSQYIDVSQSTTPTISNKGVLNAILLPGINNLNTNLNPILEDLGLTSIIPNTDIAWDPATKTLSNTGVTRIIGNVGPGISATGTTTVSLACTGVVSILPGAGPNPGLTVSPGIQPLITNTGLLSMGTGTGLINQSDQLTPYIFNNGLINLATVNSSVLISNFPDVKLATVNPSISLICTQPQNSNMSPNPLQGGLATQPPPLGLIPVTQIPGTRWATSIATQSPYSTGTFTINVSLAYRLQCGTTLPPINTGNTLFTIYDSVHNVSYKPSVNINQIQHNRVTAPAVSFNILMLRIVVDLTELWNQGFRIMTHFQLQQLAVIDPGPAFIFLQSMNSNFYAVYNTLST